MKQIIKGKMTNKGYRVQVVCQNCQLGASLGENYWLTLDKGVPVRNVECPNCGVKFCLLAIKTRELNL